MYTNSICVTWNYKGHENELYLTDINEVKDIVECLNKSNMGAKYVFTPNETTPKPEQKIEKKPEKKPGTKLVSIAFKLYDYEAPDNVKVGDFVTIMSGGQPTQYEVLKVHDDWKPELDYVEVEEVIYK